MKMSLNVNLSRDPVDNAVVVDVHHDEGCNRVNLRPRDTVQDTTDALYEIISDEDWLIGNEEAQRLMHQIVEQTQFECEEHGILHVQDGDKSFCPVCKSSYHP